MSLLSPLPMAQETGTEPAPSREPWQTELRPAIPSFAEACLVRRAEAFQTWARGQGGGAPAVTVLFVVESPAVADALRSCCRDFTVLVFDGRPYGWTQDELRIRLANRDWPEWNPREVTRATALLVNEAAGHLAAGGRILLPATATASLLVALLRVWEVPESRLREQIERLPPDLVGADALLAASWIQGGLRGLAPDPMLLEALDPARGQAKLWRSFAVALWDHCVALTLSSRLALELNVNSSGLNRSALGVLHWLGGSGADGGAEFTFWRGDRFVASGRGLLEPGLLPKLEGYGEVVQSQSRPLLDSGADFAESVWRLAARSDDPAAVGRAWCDAAPGFDRLVALGVARTAPFGPDGGAVGFGPFWQGDEEKGLWSRGRKFGAAELAGWGNRTAPEASIRTWVKVLLESRRRVPRRIWQVVLARASGLGGAHAVEMDLEPVALLETGMRVRVQRSPNYALARPLWAALRRLRALALEPTLADGGPELAAMGCLLAAGLVSTGPQGLLLTEGPGGGRQIEQILTARWPGLLLPHYAADLRAYLDRLQFGSPDARAVGLRGLMRDLADRMG